MATVFVVEAPGTPFAMLTTLPPEVVGSTASLVVTVSSSRTTSRTDAEKSLGGGSCRLGLR